MDRVSLRFKLLLSFILVGLIPFTIISLISLNKTGDALSKHVYEHLTAVREIKKYQIEKFFEDRKDDMKVLIETISTLRKEAFDKLEAVKNTKKIQIENYFNERIGDVSVLSRNNQVLNALSGFKEAFELDDRQPAGPNWQTVENYYGKWLKTYKQEYNYSDLYLIDKNGDIVFTVEKGVDLGKNLLTGSLRDSPLAKCFHRALKEVTIQDFEPYAPSNNEPSAFMGAPIKRDGQTVGVVALKLSIDDINRVMGERTGMGETGETYLVGPDKLMRSDSYLDPKFHSVRASFSNPEKGRVDTEASREALAGKSGTKVIISYNGNYVLSSYSPLRIKGLNWAIISEIDISETFCPKDLSGEYLFEKYVKMYGYPDLFLINPDGYCFYTVKKGTIYRSNLLNGKFSDTNLGRLIKRVLETKRYGIVDFEPFKPSNNEPAAFIAQPVVHDGKVEVIVALQLFPDAINSIMRQRQGMGETGETYLVGSDKLMRSDSYLDPKFHSVIASFATPQLGKVDTEAVREGLLGKSGHKTVKNYRGDKVLSAFTPINIEDINWVLVCEINESEAFKAIRHLKWFIGIIAIFGIGLIIVVALLIAKSIVRPINKVISRLKEASFQVASASSQVSSASQRLAEGASEQASSLEETSASLEEMSSMTRQNANNANEAKAARNEAYESLMMASKAMEETMEAMGRIRSSGEEIGKIIKTIDEIAFQTNLLALNAAVEAARAGEAGAGFAVVADEVRNLAMRAAEAAKNTQSLIEKTVEDIGRGSELLDRTHSAFEETVKSNKRVAELIDEIAVASGEQARGIEQISKAVSEIDKVVQETASSAEESASASEQLSAQAEEMRKVVDELIKLVEGDISRDGTISLNRVIKEYAKGGKEIQEKRRLALQKRKESQLERSKEITPDQVIPLTKDEEEGFEEF